mmetsp:Transcript_23254/g.49508  ORF Transcript_23254/g.49508 Transcript_23254/m.49508 type:complete len:415 (-) Transcript_23254:1220-2464(-)
MAPLWDADLVHLGSQDGGRLDERHVHGVVAIKLDCPWESLRRRPERGPVARLGVLREGVNQLRDPVVKVLVEDLARPYYTFRKGRAFAGAQRVHDLLQLLLGLPVRLLEGVRGVGGHILQVGVDLGGRLLHVALELRPRPRQAVVDVVRERVDGAHRSLLLRGVSRGPVVLGEARDHHLGVALGSQRARLEQRLAEVDAAHVDVEPGLDVVQGVDDDVEGLPEGVVEDVFRLWADAVLEGGDVELRVHALGRLARDLALGAADVRLAEEELPRKVALLDGVVIRHRQLAVLAARDAHHRQELEELAPERPGTDDERVQRLHLLLKLLAEDHDLAVVPRAHGLHVLKGRRVAERLDAVKVEELENGVELARAGLEGLLGDDAADEGRHGREVAPRDHRKLPQQPLVQLLLLEGPL